MLVLTRTVGEQIMIGDDIVITFLSSTSKSRQQFRVGIDAPKDMRVDRKEIRQRIIAEREAELAKIQA